jgi:hypothetical protein
MRVTPFVAALCLSFLPQQSASPIVRDPQALALLQASVRTMGGKVPSDSVASGSITIVAGSQTSVGTIRILTHATWNTSEQIILSDRTQTTIFSEGNANQTENNIVSKFSMERAASSQSLCFPLPFFAGALDNSDEAIQYIGAETLEQGAAQHIQIRNTFSSNPRLQQVSDATVADIWLDATTGLPLKISMVRRDGHGPSVPQIPLDYYYSNYQLISGVYYPFQIDISLNGTPWTRISITSVQFSVGLSDSDFIVQ